MHCKAREPVEIMGMEELEHLESKNGDAEVNECSKEEGGGEEDSKILRNRQVGKGVDIGEDGCKREKGSQRNTTESIKEKTMNVCDLMNKKRMVIQRVERIIKGYRRLRIMVGRQIHI